MNKHKRIEVAALALEGRTLTREELALVSGSSYVLKSLWTEVTDDPIGGKCRHDDHADTYFIP
jgi:hypothetical protein